MRILHMGQADEGEPLLELGLFRKQGREDGRPKY